NNRKKAYLIINFNTNQLKEEVELLNRLTRFNIYIINKQRQFLCYKSFNVELERISEGADAQFVNELFSTKDFFSISNSYFFKIKIPLNKAEFNENGNFIYLAVELPADRFLAYKEILFRKILFYVLLLFVVTLAVVYVLLFLSVLTNKRAVQLRKAMKLLELSGDGVAVTDGKGDIEYVNPAFEKMYKCSLKETAGLNIANFNSSFYGEDFYTAMQARVDNTGKWEGDIVYMSGENTRQVKHLTIEKLPDPQTGQVMYFRVYKDITRLRDSDKQIKRLNSLDYLTGLPNKRMLLTRISEKIKKFSARGGKFAVSSISIYNFKQINDSYGFDIGDKTILLFAERIKGKIRNTDILGRLGDNHFLLVSNSSPPESLKHYIADIFRICTASPFMINEWEIYLSINVGISIYPDNGADGEELIKTASLARGDKLPDDRLAVNFYLDKMLLKAKEKSNMLSLLEKAIQRKELYLEFQPKVDSRNGELVGAEALTRWNNEKLGKVLPCDFIPLAVDNGLISKISYWVIRELCSQLKTWRERGLEIKPVSFNLSIYDLEREDFPSYLFACVDECGVESGDIQIELTERVLAKNKNKVIEKITQLKKRGFKVLIDDFGTGYSSLEYLKEFKMDTLKVDRAFIKDYPEKSKGEIVKTICELAESLGIEVVCEGVENKSQVDFLASIGCRIIQGFYYSPPVSPEVFADMLIEGKVKGREV
ncbi:MAG: GGDEF domain-containing protein, partial [Victivallaceae bacterium]